MYVLLSVLRWKRQKLQTKWHEQLQCSWLTNPNQITKQKNQLFHLKRRGRAKANILNCNTISNKLTVSRRHIFSLIIYCSCTSLTAHHRNLTSFATELWLRIAYFIGNFNEKPKLLQLTWCASIVNVSNNNNNNNWLFSFNISHNTFGFHVNQQVTWSGFIGLNGVKTIIDVKWTMAKRTENVTQAIAHCQSVFAMDMINWTELGQIHALIQHHTKRFKHIFMKLIEFSVLWYYNLSQQFQKNIKTMQQMCVYCHTKLKTTIFFFSLPPNNRHIKM